MHLYIINKLLLQPPTSFNVSIVRIRQKNSCNCPCNCGQQGHILTTKSNGIYLQQRLRAYPYSKGFGRILTAEAKGVSLQ
ncbi:hypothetical protein GDO81_012503 [Engystomops pustulosus]|uniref:Uncharacterized protein n=1 Tax=Engystomops pustulosus TaxID=76066 RepID=A0AAV7BN75_ENGPU|nr:hypothetical protein GDO81_012503 [Engystomops pustulosus]